MPPISKLKIESVLSQQMYQIQDYLGIYYLPMHHVGIIYIIKISPPSSFSLFFIFSVTLFSLIFSIQRDQYQSSYRVLVASSPLILAKNVGDYWDSDQIVANDTINIIYRGNSITSSIYLNLSLSFSHSMHQGREYIGK